MRLPQVTRIPLSPDWKPEDTARVIHDEVEKKWNEGWIFLRAETDALLESVCLYFDRPETEPQPPEFPKAAVRGVPNKSRPGRIAGPKG